MAPRLYGRAAALPTSILPLWTMDQQSDTRIGMDTFVAETVADARWFPLRYDMVADRIQFIWLTADDHQKATFLFSPALT